MALETVGSRAVIEGVGSYIANANRVNDATARIGTTAQTAARQSDTFFNSLRSGGERMREVGTTAVLLGSALTAPGVLAAKMAIDFETALTKVVTLSGIGVDAIDEMRDAVLRLSAETGQAPQELAAGLLVVTSTGLKGAEALAILEASAKASAAGLGETSDIARTITAAVKAYGSENLTAAHAADVLFATVREGGAEVDSVAGAFGRVLGIAAQVGVSFEDVGAFVATFTRLGVGADEAVTALRGTLTTFLKPSKEAQEALDGVGLSAEKLRQIAKERGLSEALFTLLDAFEGNDEAIAAVIPNVRALSGVLGVAGKQGESLKGIVEALRNSQGDLDDAFATTAETAQFKFTRAINDLRIELLRVGTDLLPLVTQLIGLVRDLAGVFLRLPAPVRTATIALGALLGVTIAFGGAAAIVGGNIAILLGAVGGIPAVAGLASAGIAGVTTALLPLIAPAAIAGIALIGGALLAVELAAIDAASGLNEFDKTAEAASEGLDPVKIAAQIADFEALRDAIAADIVSFREQGVATADLETQLADLEKTITGLRATISDPAALEARLKELEAERQSTLETIEALEAKGIASLGLRDDVAELDVQIGRLRTRLDELKSGANDSADALDDEADAANDLGDASTGAAIKLGSLEAAQLSAADAAKVHEKALDDLIAKLDEQRAAEALKEEARVQRAFRDADLIQEAAGLGDPFSFDAADRGTLSAKERAELIGNQREFDEQKRREAEQLANEAERAGRKKPEISERDQALQDTAERQRKQRITALLKDGEEGLLNEIRLQAQLNSEFADFAEVLRMRFGVEVPEAFQSMFEEIKRQTEDAGHEIGGVLGILLARRLAAGQDAGGGLVSTGPFRPGGIPLPAPTTQVTIENVNIGRGAQTTAGEVAIGMQDGLRAPLRAQR